jgi:hypothetical protein
MEGALRSGRDLAARLSESLGLTGIQERRAVG